MSGRLEKDPTANFRQLVLGHELSELGDAALLPLIHVNVTHVRMLAKQGLMPEATARKLIDAMGDIAKQGVSSLDTEHTEDVYYALEQKLIDLLGISEVGNTHIGRSRNDIYSTIYRLIIREKLLSAARQLLLLSRNVLTLAGKYRDAVMPGYTHTQHAQPVSLGYYLLGYFEALMRDMLRLRNTWDIVNRSPMGAAAITTTRFPLDRQHISDLLGFDSFLYNAYDAIAGREYVNDTAMALNTIASDVSRFVADLMTWCMSEFGFVETPDEYAVISSIMPQKKNPAGFEFLRSAASWVLGDTVGVVSSAKAISYSDIRDATKYHYSPLWHAFEVTENMLSLFAEMLPAIGWNTDRMLKATAEGYSSMTDLADYFVEKHGITFREAHGIVANFVRLSLADGRKSDNLSLETLKKVCRDQGFDFEITQKDLDDTLDPRQCLKRRDVAGGTSDRQMDIMLGNDEELLKKELVWLEEKESALRTLRDKMFD